jgi:3-hydroxyacyl-CoA dehydrogenase
MLEFIDWGGGDILYYASRYLTQALGSERYAAPEIVERNMRRAASGSPPARAFLDYEKLDVDAYRADALKALSRMLRPARPHAAAGAAGVGAFSPKHVLEHGPSRTHAPVLSTVMVVRMTGMSKWPAV